MRPRRRPVRRHTARLRVPYRRAVRGHDVRDRPVDRTVELARAAEERGFDSLWVPEHTHIPTSRRTPPPTGDDELRRGVQAHARPVRRARPRPPRSPSGSLGTGHLPRRAARPDRHGEGGRDARPRVGRPVRARHRLRLERGRDRATTASTCRPRRGRPRARARDAGAVGGGGRRVRRRARRLRAVVVVAEAGAARRPAGAASAAPPGPKLFAHIAEYGDGWIPIGGAGVRDALPDAARACERPAATRRRCASSRSAPCPTPGSSSTTRSSASARSCCASRAATATPCSPSRRVRRARRVVSPAIVGLDASGSPEAWRAAGFTVEGERTVSRRRDRSVRIRIGGPGAASPDRPWPACRPPR